MPRMLTTLLFILLLAPALRAQIGRGGAGDRFARIKAAKEAFLREELALTPAEAEAFFPVYWRYEREIRQLRPRMMGLRGGPPPTSATMTETEARAKLAENRQQRRELMALHNRAEDAYLKLLPATKVILLEPAEQAFRQELLSRLKQSGGRRRN